MQVEHIIILALSGLGVFHGLALGFYLAYSGFKRKSSYFILGVLLVLMGVRISKSIFLYFMDDLDYIFITLGLTLILSFGPLFYFYVRSYLDESFSFSRKDMLHGIPFLILFVLNSFMLLSKEFYLAFGIYFIYLHFLTYIIASFLFHRMYQYEQQGTLDTVRKSWLRYLHIGIVFVWVSYFMFLLDELVPYILGPITYSIVIYPLSFWAISKQAIRPQEQKYQNSNLSYSESEQLLPKLESYMNSEHPYLDANIKLSQMAKTLNVTPHTLSQVVNQHVGINFQQYLNSYRVRYAMERLSSKKYDHLTISSIAFESGFNSLSAFNAAFKKIANMTPSQYKKSEGANN